jgi:hypothetical protein
MMGHCLLPDSLTQYLPHIIEPAIGLDRLMLALLTERPSLPRMTRDRTIPCLSRPRLHMHTNTGTHACAYCTVMDCSASARGRGRSDCGTRMPRRMSKVVSALCCGCIPRHPLPSPHPPGPGDDTPLRRLFSPPRPAPPRPAPPRPAPPRPAPPRLAPPRPAPPRPAPPRPAPPRPAPPRPA